MSFLDYNIYDYGTKYDHIPWNDCELTLHSSDCTFTTDGYFDTSHLKYNAFVPSFPSKNWDLSHISQPSFEGEIRIAVKKQSAFGKVAYDYFYKSYNPDLMTHTSKRDIVCDIDVKLKGKHEYTIVHLKNVIFTTCDVCYDEMFEFSARIDYYDKEIAPYEEQKPVILADSVIDHIAEEINKDIVKKLQESTHNMFVDVEQNKIDEYLI